LLIASFVWVVRVVALSSLALLTMPSFTSIFEAQGQEKPEYFMPLLPGTFWVYRGTTRSFDQDHQKPYTAKVSLKMSVEKVLYEPEFTAAVFSGFPSDLDWSGGTTSLERSLWIETKSHSVYLHALEPSTDLIKLERDPAALAKYMSEESFLFQWPLKKGQKFCDPESRKRQDDRYCWVVATQTKRDRGKRKGSPMQTMQIFLLQYVTNPEDQQMDLSPGLGLVGCRYHHHGSVADTQLSLVEFHRGENSSPGIISKP
jgi:hypothetical protein